MKISAVPTHELAWVWPLIVRYMDECAVYTNGRYTADDIKATLPNRQLWIAYDDKVYGAVVTEVMEYPQMKALCMHFTGGEDLPKWKDAMLSVLRSFAKDTGCKVIESTGRAGWSRIFKDDGYKSDLKFYELPIGE